MRILTFDIEEWFHCDFVSGDLNWEKYDVRIKKGVDKILTALADRNQKATFLCLGWIASTYPGVIRSIHSQGHQIGCHSNKHDLVFKLSKSQFESDTERAIKSIEDVVGEKVELYRAPAFSITEKNTWAFEVLAKNNIKYDCSIFPSKHEYGGFPSFGNSAPAILNINGYQMKEFPINIKKVLGKNIVFSGGGYFRLFPYTLIHNWMEQSDYIMTYFHPRDFDPDQPMLSHLPLHRKFKSYIGLKSAFAKFTRLLDDFDFVNIEEADKIIDWDRAKTIRIP